MSRYWCHDCNAEASATVGSDGDISCQVCNGSFVEVIENGEEQREVEEFSRRREEPQPQTQQASPMQRWQQNYVRVFVGGDGDDNMLRTLMDNLATPAGAGNSADFDTLLGNYGFAPQFEGAGNRTMADILHQLLHEGPTGPPPAAAEAIEALNRFEVDQAFCDSKPELCSVCQEEWKSDDICLQMPCGHYFHEDCLMPWISSHNTCPYCRHELMTDDPDYEQLREQRQLEQSNSQD